MCRHYSYCNIETVNISPEVSSFVGIKIFGNMTSQNVNSDRIALVDSVKNVSLKSSDTHSNVYSKEHQPSGLEVIDSSFSSCLELENVSVDSEQVADELNTDDEMSNEHSEDADLEEGNLTLQGRSLKYRVLEDNTDFKFHSTSSDSKNVIDKFDPRSRLHFVKYVNEGGKRHKIWECGLCGKEFRHQYILLRHVPTHTDERNFACEVCGKSFRQLSTLAQHKAIHSNIRPYICEVCKKTFNRVSTLISHRKTHSSEKPHKCEICGKGFHQKGNLRNHVFTHTNERPYKCDICGKGFNQMSNLVCHKSHVHTEKRSYYCRLCHRVFPGRYAMRRHQECKHDVLTPKKTDKLPFTHFLSDPDISNIKYIDGKYTLVDCNTESNKTFNDLNLCDKLNTSGVIIDAIKTKAMKVAREANRPPFALLKPVKGVPVLVKVRTISDGKEMLVPATAQDLKSVSKVTVSPNVTNNDTLKSVQIKVPIVATVIQTCDANGELTIHVKPPGPEICDNKREEFNAAPITPRVNLESDITDEGSSSVSDPKSEVLDVIDTEVLEDKDSSICTENALNSLPEFSESEVPENSAFSELDQVNESENTELSVEDVRFVKYLEDGKCELVSQQDVIQVINESGEVISIETYNGDENAGDMTMSDLVDILRSAGYFGNTDK